MTEHAAESMSATCGDEGNAGDVGQGDVPVHEDDVRKLDEEGDKLSEAIAQVRAKDSDTEAWVALTADEGVQKRVLKHGQGPLPDTHSVCLVHYIGRLQSDGKVFMETRDEQQEKPVQVVAGRDFTAREKGLNIAVASMRAGERCQLRVTPEYGYGAKGSFSFPSVPADAALEYDLELVTFSPPEDKPKSKMFFEERLEAAQRQRKRANDLFAAGQVSEAVAGYQAALPYVDEDLTMQLHGRFLEQAHEVLAPIHLNLAACHLRLESWDDAAKEATTALAVCADPAQRTKALFRRGRAHAGMGRTEDGIRDMMAALVLSPNDPSISRELSRLRGTLRAEQKAADSLFKDKLKANSSAKASEATSTSDGHSAPQRVYGWDATMDELSWGERTFHWVTDQLIDLLDPLWRWLKWKPAKFCATPAPPPAQHAQTT